MCVVSAVLDYGRQIPSLDPDYWKQLQLVPGVAMPSPSLPSQVPGVPMPSILPSVWFPQPVAPLPLLNPEPELDKETIVKEFLKLVKQAAILDEAAKQKDCEDPEKVKFLEKILTRIDTIDQELLALKEEIKGLLKLDEKI